LPAAPHAPAAPARPRVEWALYALAIFTGAFLLFQVQPLIGRYVLPWFGGAPEVWTTCLLFFQSLLLAGYAYAHLSVRVLPGRAQAAVQLALLAAALAVLPIVPSEAWKPAGPDWPLARILLLLSVAVGLPYFVLASTTPLLQGWIARTRPGASPYWLYALSNAGSLLALVSYPFVLEPLLGRDQQAAGWGWALGAYAAFCGGCALAVLTRPGRRPKPPPAADAPGDALPPPRRRLLWLALPAAASVELLAVTNKLTLDLAPVPFLWILPLALYLLSFVLVFQSERFYVRPVFLAAFLVSLGGVMALRIWPDVFGYLPRVVIYTSALFFCCMVCHGEVARMKPHPRHLTQYYLLIAAGGALGGVFVAVVAPRVFTDYTELYLGLLGACLFVLLADRTSRLARSRRKWLYVAGVLAVCVAAVVHGGPTGTRGYRAVASLRNFFGVLTVWEADADDPLMHRYLLQHGTTLHGVQFVHPSKRDEPTAYYGRDSGVGLAVENLPASRPRRIGVVGLGVGTLATYGREGDLLRFYEINPDVERVAREAFAYLSGSPAEVEVVLGDARVSMEGEPPQQYDLLVLDAFNSDAVPVHLLTVEAFELYLRHLRPDGIIACHISTQHLDLERVLLRLGEHFDLHTAWVETPGKPRLAVFSSDWILMSRSKAALSRPAVRSRRSEPPPGAADVDLWTDDHVNLLEILH
jgi:hypothetical protein